MELKAGNREGEGNAVMLSLEVPMLVCTLQLMKWIAGVLRELAGIWRFLGNSVLNSFLDLAL